MIYTSTYDKYKNPFYGVSISNDHGDKVKFGGLYYSPLIPSNDIDKIQDPEEFAFEYIDKVLLNLDAYKIFRDIDSFVLLDYPDSIRRHIVAAWFKDSLDIEIPDIYLPGDELTYQELERPGFIEDLYKHEKEKALKKRR